MSSFNELYEKLIESIEIFCLIASSRKISLANETPVIGGEKGPIISNLFFTCSHPKDNALLINQFKKDSEIFRIKY